MKSLFRVIFIMSLVAGFMSCKSDDDEPALLGAGEMVRIDGDVIKGLEDAMPYVCTSAAEARALLGNAAPLNVDFSKNVIIIVKDTARKGVDDIRATVTPSGSDLDVKVVVTLNYTDPVIAWCIGVVAPKTGDNNARLTIDYSL